MFYTFNLNILNINLLTLNYNDNFEDSFLNLIELNFFKNFNYYYILENFFNYVFFFIFWVTLFIVFFNFNKFNKIIFLFSRFINKLIINFEQEISNINNVMVIFSLILLFFGFTFFNFLQLWNISFFIKFNFFMLIFFITFILLLPIFLIFEYGFFFLTYIRGSFSSKVLILELIFDYINIISFFLRLNIQLIRIVIIFVFLFLYTEIYCEFIYPFYSNNNQNWVTHNFYQVTYFYLINFFSKILYIIYELGHFLTIFFLQSSIFINLLFIIFQLLYSAFILTSFENYFELKRKFKN